MRPTGNFKLAHPELADNPRYRPVYYQHILFDEPPTYVVGQGVEAAQIVKALLGQLGGQYTFLWIEPNDSRFFIRQKQPTLDIPEGQPDLAVVRDSTIRVTGAGEKVITPKLIDKVRRELAGK